MVSSTSPPVSEAGKAAYEAYATEREWVSYGGDPLPRWEEQDDSLRAAWDAAATAASEAAKQERGS